MNILHEFIAPGDRVVMATPTFDGFPALTTVVGGAVVAVPLTADGRQDLEAMAAAVNQRTRLLVLCNPHNPTGTCFTHAELDGFLARIGDNVTVVLDEAYREFLAEHDRADVGALLARYPNLIVTRTFSKAYGLAALRIGYGFGAAPTIARIRRGQLPYAINSLAEPAVRACYAAEDELALRVEAINRERDRLVTALHELHFDHPRSSANFVYLPAPETDSLTELCAVFNRARIEVKRCPTGVRITVADRAATDAVVATLAASTLGTR
jgi:histidinol-phosphate aminotransferase